MENLGVIMTNQQSSKHVESTRVLLKIAVTNCKNLSHIQLVRKSKPYYVPLLGAGLTESMRWFWTILYRAGPVRIGGRVL